MSTHFQEAKNPIFLHLDLSIFKTQRCPSNHPHDAKKCFHYHFPSERRRSLCQVFYQKNLCPGKSDCNNEHCPFSHNFVEQIYHADSYKKRYCKDFIEKGRCKYDAYCAMAHSDMELKITPLHLLPVDKNFLLFRFKSEFCPFSKISHDRFKCVYAHNWQDYKRPYSSSIQPSLCKNWDKNKEILEYEQGCERAFHCNFSHGWKEVEYHYLNFKRQPCKMGSECDRREICSFLHGNEEVEKETVFDEMFHPCDKAMIHDQITTLNYLYQVEVDFKRTAVSVSNKSSYKEMPKIRLQVEGYSPTQDYEEDMDFDKNYSANLNIRLKNQEAVNRHFSSKNIGGEHHLLKNGAKNATFYSEKHIYGLLMNRNNLGEDARARKLQMASKLTSFEQRNFMTDENLYSLSETMEMRSGNKVAHKRKTAFTFNISYFPKTGMRSFTQLPEPESKHKPSFDIVSINFQQMSLRQPTGSQVSSNSNQPLDRKQEAFNKKGSETQMTSEKLSNGQTQMEARRGNLVMENGRQFPSEAGFRQVAVNKGPVQYEEEDF
jgi:hypothetical protein